MSCQLFLNDFSEELMCRPLFNRQVTRYIEGDSKRFTFQQVASASYFAAAKSTEVNRSWCTVEAIIENGGEESEVIKNVTLTIEGNYERITLNREGDVRGLPPLNDPSVTLYDTRPVEIIVNFDEPLILEPEDTWFFSFHLLPRTDAGVVDIDWRITGENTTSSGNLRIISEPEFIDTEETVTLQEEPLPDEKIQIVERLELMDTSNPEKTGCLFRLS